VRSDDRTRNFELLALPHLNAVYRHAAWLAGNTADAEDVAQEVYLRAFRYFDAYKGGDFRVWLLAIVRNTFITWTNANRTGRLVFRGDAVTGDSFETEEIVWGAATLDPEALLIQRVNGELLERLIQRLPVEYREVLVLREMEDLAYKDIARIIRAPIGTVMSRLLRARLALKKLWLAEADAETNADRAPHPSPIGCGQQSSLIDDERPHHTRASRRSGHREPIAVAAAGPEPNRARWGETTASRGRRTAGSHRACE
jgi:RNA polymerase sigma-70 factor (ECF subfamily)